MMKFTILWIIFYLVRYICCDCFLQIPENKENVPLWKKKIGDDWLNIPYISHRLKLQNGEIINGYCATKFREIGYNVKIAVYCKHYDHDCQRNRMHTQIKYMAIDERNITLTCDGSSLKYKSDFLGEDTMSCKDVKWSINMKLNQVNDRQTSWCNGDYQIFDLTTNNLDKNRVLAKICFHFSLRSVKYKTIKRKTETWNEKKYSFREEILKTLADIFLPVAINDLPEATTLSSEVKFLNTTILHIGNEGLQRYLKVLQEKNRWLSLANYEYGSIIQNNPFLNYFHQYNQLLDILWWQNLRLTNWRRFLDALDHHTTNNSYEVCMGTLNVVQVPLWSNSNEFEYLEVQNGFVNNTVPQYIWIYLESNDAKNPDLYIFAYNSPYASFFESNQVKFCLDICSEIDWLKSVHSSFGYVNCGIIFCCTPDTVKTSAYAVNLPEKLITPVSGLMDNDFSMIKDNAQDFPNKDMLHKAQEAIKNTFQPKPGELTIKTEKPKLAEDLGKFNALESFIYNYPSTDTEFSEANSACSGQFYSIWIRSNHLYDNPPTSVDRRSSRSVGSVGSIDDLSAQYLWSFGPKRFQIVAARKLVLTTVNTSLYILQVHVYMGGIHS
uniref:Uncharacterized protein n=1 Tax=Glossina brevipalpis TaxID=37001 RepID=A0A1A9WKG6_9MUSC